MQRAVAAATVLLAGGQLAREPGVSGVERRAFRVLNRGVGSAERPVWVLMQFGNGLVAAVAPVALVVRGRSWSDASRVGLAAGGAWYLAKGVKAVVDRGRPAALLDDVHLRDGDPDGRGFVSGHATVAMSVALAAGPMVSTRTRRGLVGAAIGVGLARIHVGAHLPLDVVGAIALATLWGPVCAPGLVGSSGGPQS